MKNWLKKKLSNAVLGYNKDTVRSPFRFIHKFMFGRELIGVEIGVFEGNNAVKILNFLPIRRMYLVDPWIPYEDKNTKVVSFSESMEYWDHLYAKVYLKFCRDRRVHVRRYNSIEMAKYSRDWSFDFVYLDGDHSYEAVIQDLRAWYPKLKLYGVMCGDDYGHPSGTGVIKAVSEFAYEKKLIVNISNEDNQFWFVKTNE